MDNYDMDHSTGTMYENGTDDLGLNWNGVIKNEKPRASQVRFYWEGVENEKRSREAGHTVYEQVCFISIASRNKIDVVVRKATQKDFDTYPEQFRIFKRTEKKIDGLPLAKWPAISRVQMMNLNAAGIFSVEQLRDASDEKLSFLGGDGLSLREQAEAYLLAARDSSLVTKQAKIIREIQTDKQVLEQQIAALKLELAGKHAVQNAGVSPSPVIQPSIDIQSLKAELLASLRSELPEKKDKKVVAKGKTRKKVLVEENENEEVL